MDVDGAAHHLGDIHRREDGVFRLGKGNMLRTHPQGDLLALDLPGQKAGRFLRGELDLRAPQFHGVAVPGASQPGVEEVHLRHADEPGHEDVRRVVEHLLGRPHLLDEAVFHDDDPVPQGHGLGLVVGDVDKGGVQLLPELDDLRAHLIAQLCVQVGQGLVHQKHLGLPDDGPPNGHPLLLTAGEGLGLALEELGDVEDLRRLPDLLVDDPLGELAEPQPIGDVVVDGHMGVEGIVLEDHGDIPVLGRSGIDLFPADVELPPGDLLQPRHHAQGGGLAAPGGPYQHDELLVRDLQVEFLDRHHGVVIDLLDVLKAQISHRRHLRLCSLIFSPAAPRGASPRPPPPSPGSWPWRSGRSSGHSG